MQWNCLGGRYREGPNRKQRYKTFSVREFPTQKALRRHLTTLIEILDPPTLRTFQRSTRGNASQGKNSHPHSIRYSAFSRGCANALSN
jgi:hypothetical protein